MLLRRRAPASNDAPIALLRRASRDARHPATSTRALARYSSAAARRRPSRLASVSSPTLRPPLPYITTAPTTAIASKRHASTSTKPKPKSKGGGSGRGVYLNKNHKRVAVLGGGITGLTTAHYLARYGGPHIHVTLYEASDRLGGWVHGKSVSSAAAGEEEVLFQHGPRVLRSGTNSNKYDDLVLYDVVSCCA